jgi:hypothetical protein
VLFRSNDLAATLTELISTLRLTGNALYSGLFIPTGAACAAQIIEQKRCERAALLWLSHSFIAFGTNKK